MTKVNERLIIATPKQMVEAGLFDCKPEEDRILLWSYEKKIVSKGMGWDPIVEVRTEPLKEDIVNENGEVIEPKSTHEICGFYFPMVWGRVHFEKFLENRGVVANAI